MLFLVTFGFQSCEDLEEVETPNFDVAFNSVNPSKVNLGKYRRELSALYLKNIETWKDLEENDVVEKFIANM